MNMPGVQTAWAEASFEERETIHQTYREYTHGLLWFLKTNPRLPEAVREDMARYGFCKDEWPPVSTAPSGSLPDHRQGLKDLCTTSPPFSPFGSEARATSKLSRRKQIPAVR